MNAPSLDIVIIGLSITSSWGNGHATTYRGLVKELTKSGHKVTFLERDVEWYASNRDLPNPSFCITRIYYSFEELQDNYSDIIKNADLVIVGSYVFDGVKIGEWITGTAKGVTAFYDIDTPVTIAKLKSGDNEYLNPELVSKYDLYLSFTGGPILNFIEQVYDSPLARPLYCSVDPALYYPQDIPKIYDLGYLATYSPDRQPPLETLMLDAARNFKEGNFIVAGPMYPKSIKWPNNVEYIYHLSPKEHNKFYNSQKFTMNITRADMIEAGYSPSVRLFEASACGIPIISDYWDGLELFFEIGKEILVSRSYYDTLQFLKKIPEEERIKIGERARYKVLQKHTAAHRANDLENYFLEIKKNKIRII